jgi:hypothetical protein
MKIKSVFVYTFFIGFFVLSILSGIILTGCRNKNNIKAPTYLSTGNDVLDGKNLVQVHCVKCHALVPVDALTKDVWVYHAMPSMAAKFGLSDYGGNQYYINNAAASISLADWQKIIKYYSETAPSVLPAATTHVPLQMGKSIFKIITPDACKAMAYTTMVAINPFNNSIYTSDLLTRELYQWDKNLKPTVIANLQTSAVSADFSKDKGNKTDAVFLSEGTIDDVDSFLGTLTKVAQNQPKPDLNDTTIASALPRPVNVTHGDFNRDGLTDYVVCCEGHSSGGLYLYTQTTGGQFAHSKIKDGPGAVQAITGDFNNDGWPDIMALFGKGDEGLWMFINNQKGGFTAKRLLKFPPVYGSSSFQLVDLNNDGKPDILYTCGDNFGDSRILKPYHGVYIYLNTGDFNFKQSYFYPINGCTKAIAADFDHSGRPGFITIAFFADLKNNPSEQCIYFSQDRPWHFTPYAIPVNKYGRWKSMDISNDNGNMRVILGNYATGFKTQDIITNWNVHLPFIVLEAKSKSFR